jgi:hypothetical protein
VPVGTDIWALNNEGFVVPSDGWTKVPWNTIVLNNTPAHLDADDATWIFPIATTAGLWVMLCNVAWDNAKSPDGDSISPATHRKLMRIVQQNAGRPQGDEVAYTGAASEVLYHNDLARLGDQGVLSDGSKGYQQQQVTVQAGFSPEVGTDQRTWVEVYQDSGEPLVCRFDGSSAPKMGDRPRLVGLLAPSIMFGKLCDW